MSDKKIATKLLLTGFNVASWTIFDLLELLLPNGNGQIVYLLLFPKKNLANAFNEQGLIRKEISVFFFIIIGS